jgi:uncharacterized protein (DUF2336 family)
MNTPYKKEQKRCYLGINGKEIECKKPMNTAREVLNALGTEEKTYLAEMIPLPHDIIEQFAIDEDAIARQAIALNPQLPQSLIYKLSKDSQGAVREAIAKRTLLPLAIIECLALDEDEYVRRAIALRPELPSAVIQELSKDPSKLVRDAITERAHKMV